MHAAVAVHIAYVYGTTVMAVAVDLVTALCYLAHFHLFVAMMLGFDHAVYLHAIMMYMSYGYCCFGLGGKHAH